jgi:hypothetical protein
MLKAASASFAAAFLLLFLVTATGNLMWDNRLLWGPPILFFVAGALGLAGLEHDEHRGPLLLIGAAAFCSLLGYGVFYFFLFGLVGH